MFLDQIFEVYRDDAVAWAELCTEIALETWPPDPVADLGE